MLSKADPLAFPGELTCYTCGNEYDYVGDGPHPGVCPDCGERLVSFAGDIEEVALQSNGEPGDVGHVITARVADATDRTFHYSLTPDTTHGTVVPYMVRVGETRVTRRAEIWCEGLFPAALQAALDDSYGLEFVMEPRRRRER